MAEPITFRAAAPAQDGKRAAVRVTVHPTLKTLRAALIACEGTVHKDERLEGFFHAAHEVGWGGRKLPMLGDIHVARSTCSLNTLIHETTHAVLSWMHRKPERAIAALHPWAGEGEEAICFLLAGLSLNIIRGCQKYGVRVHGL